MERYLCIIKNNFKYYLFPHILVACSCIVLSPCIMGLESLNVSQVDQIINIYLSLFGIIFFVPIFMADENKCIREILQSKKEPLILIHIIRWLEMFVCYAILMYLFLKYLEIHEGQFPFLSCYFATISNGFFLGGLGVFIYGITDLLPAGYMVPMLYYLLNYGDARKYLGMFYLFYPHSDNSKLALFLAGVVLTALGIWIRDHSGWILHRIRVKFK